MASLIFQPPEEKRSESDICWLGGRVIGGQVAGGWSLGGWWLQGWWLVVVVPNTHTHTQTHRHIDYRHKKGTHIFCTRATGCKVFGYFGELPAQFLNLPGGKIFFYILA